VERLEPSLLQPLEALLQGLPLGAMPAPLPPARQQAKAVAARRAQLQRLKSLVQQLEDSIRFSFQVWSGWAQPSWRTSALRDGSALEAVESIRCCWAWQNRGQAAGCASQG
jgi:hypothetical protein